MKKQGAKETNIELQVKGYASRWGGMGTDVCIVVSGQGPNGKLKARAYFDGERIDVRGDDRYSPMHGNSSLYFSEPIYKDIEKGAISLAKQWIAQNPNAARENLIAMAREKLSNCQARVATAKSTLASRESDLKNAHQELAEAEAAK